MDKLTPEQRRKCMQAVKGRDTLPEIVVRKWLHAHGFRFRVCDKRIVGHPDVVLPKLKTLIETALSQISRSGWQRSESWQSVSRHSGYVIGYVGVDSLFLVHAP